MRRTNNRDGPAAEEGGKEIEMASRGANNDERDGGDGGHEEQKHSNDDHEAVRRPNPTQKLVTSERLVTMGAGGSFITCVVALQILCVFDKHCYVEVGPTARPSEADRIVPVIAFLLLAIFPLSYHLSQSKSYRTIASMALLNFVTGVALAITAGVCFGNGGYQEDVATLLDRDRYQQFTPLQCCFHTEAADTYTTPRSACCNNDDCEGLPRCTTHLEECVQSVSKNFHRNCLTGTLEDCCNAFSFADSDSETDYCTDSESFGCSDADFRLHPCCPHNGNFEWVASASDLWHDKFMHLIYFCVTGCLLHLMVCAGFTTTLCKMHYGFTS